MTWIHLCKGWDVKGLIKLISTDIRCLMFADDLAVVTESGSDLQNALRALEVYCDTWGLSINVEKTKIVIFRRSPREHNTDFRYQQCRVEQVKFHNYLGLVLSGTGGTFRRGINKLQKQAKRSTFGVLRHLRKLAHGRLPVETLYHTFRTLILPIMTYAAEVWAYDVGIAYKKIMTAIQMKFLKYVLGVGQSTPNVAVLLELGEYPVEMFLKMKVIDWWRKISNTDHILLKEALLIHQREQTPWFHHLSDTLAELGCNAEDPNSLALSREVIYTKLEQQDIIHTVGNTAKLGVLRTCKQGVHT